MSNFPHGVCYMAEYGMAGDFATTISGGPPNPNYFDNAPAWNAIMAQASPGDTFVLPPGYSGFKSSPAQLPSYTKLMGAGGNSAMVKGTYTGDNDVFLRFGQTYSLAEDLTIFIADGIIGGVACGHIATNVNDAGYHIVHRNITASSFGVGKWSGGCRIDGLNGTPHYGSRNHTISGFTPHSCRDYGLMIAGCNDVSVSDFSAIVDASGWGIWTIGNAAQPTTLVNISGPVETSVLMYSTFASAVHAAVLGQVTTDGDCQSNSFYAGYLGGQPQLGGTNNHVYANGTIYSSAA